MDIPEGARVCCAADLFEYDEDKALNFQKFFSLYKDQFPMLIVIIGGYYGTTKLDCYDNLQVLRVHCYTTQPRVIVEDSRLNPTVRVGYISIPEDTKIPFRVVKGHTKMGNPQPLKEILEEHKTLPLLLQLACDPQYPIKVGMSRHVARDFGNIFVMERFTEHFFIMNSIDGVDLNMNKLTCMACLSEELDATPVTGFKYKSKAEFDEFCRTLSKDVAESGEVYDRTAGNGDFAEYSFDDMRHLLAVSEYKTGTMSEQTETEESDSDEYEEVPPLPPPRDSPRDTDQNQSEARDKDQNQSEANIMPDKSKNTKHFFSGMLHQQKSPKGSKTGKESKGAFGFFKKKHQDEADKTDGKPIPKTVKPKTSAYNKEVQDSNLQRSPLELPPQIPARSCTQKPDQSKINTRADGGYITLKDNSGYQNTKIGRATVKPMPRENVEQRNEEEDLKKELEEEDEYERLDEVPSTKSEKDSVLEKSDQRKAVALGLQDKCQQIITDPDDGDDMYEDMGAFDNDYLEPKSPVVKSLEENDEKQHSEDHQQIADASELSIKEVGEKLIELKLEKYKDVFEENQVDGEILKSLSVDDLVNELGLKKLEALRLYKFAASGHIPR